ncbi:MAG: IPT/TIG domain-containing protein, partial [Syntrophobacteraceae bacterium]
MTASAAAGGAITPEGAIPVSAGSSLTFTAAPDPGYQLIALIVDGATAGGPSVYPSTYTFSNIVSDHTITALFAHYLDYFGMQAGNHEEARVTYLSGVVQTQTDDISLDTTSFAQPSYVDLQVLPGISGSIWYQVYSNGLFMKQMQSSGYTFTFTPALPMIQTPLAPGAHWTASSAVKANLVSGTARIRAIVSPRVLVSVPAGHFLAWPIAYTLTVSGPGGTSTTPMTYWFAPYFGTVIGKDSKTTTRMTKFAVGGGTITTAPPVVTGIVPGSATIGSKISITGFQFGHLQGSSKLRIGNVECDQILSWTDTQIRCVVPETAPSGAVTVVTDTWTSNDSVKLLISPQITGVTPSSGKRGSVVKIMGNNLGTPPGKVKLGSVRAAVIQWGDTSISFTVPATMSYGTYAVTVFNSQGQSVLRRAFTVVK